LSCAMTDRADRCVFHTRMLRLLPAVASGIPDTERKRKGGKERRWGWRAMCGEMCRLG
jgi:hypothetical protein